MTAETAIVARPNCIRLFARPELTNEADLGLTHYDGKDGAQQMLDVRSARFNGRFERYCGMLAPVKSSVANDNAFRRSA